MIHTLISTQAARRSETSVQVRNKGVFPLVEVGAAKTSAVKAAQPSTRLQRQPQMLWSRPNIFVVGANDN